MTQQTETKPDASAGHSAAELKPPYGWAAIVGGMVFLLYAITLARTTAFWDASEYIATAKILGIPHPPGNPLFVVLSRAWTVLLEPTGFSVAVRVNLFSAFMSAASHALWFLILHHILRYFSRERFVRLAGAAASVLVSATAFTVWNQSNVNEKVYTVSLLSIAILSWLIIRWQERLGQGGDDNILVLMAFVLALSVGNHLMTFLAAPAIGIFILLVNPKAVLNWKLYPPIVVAALLGLSIHLFLPIRAELDPIINEGAPECETLGSAIASVATYGRAGCEPLNSSINREQYKVEGEPGPGLSGPRQSPIPSQYANYLQYFDWQWARSVEGEDTLFPPLRVIFTMLFTALGVWGAMEHHARDPKSFWYMATLLGTLSVGLVWYLNFKYGYSMPDPLNDYTLHEVRERDYFFIASFSLWGLWVGLGLTAIWMSLKERFGSWRRGSPIMVVAFLPLVMNWGYATRDYDFAARDWAYNLLMSVEPYGILFTNGDNDTFPLWYLQEVEEIRQDVQVIVTSYLNTDWYAKQVRDLTQPCPAGVRAEDTPTRIVCQREYRTENTTGVYTGDASSVSGGQVPILMNAPVRAPVRGTLELEDDIIDQVAGAYVEIREPRSIALGPLTVTINGGSYLSAWQQFAFSIIANSIEDRPIYFSSGGSASGSLGLGDFIVREGLAYRLLPTAPDSTAGVVPMPAESIYTQVTGRWVNEERTRVLMDEVFVHRGEIPNWDHWPDRAAIGIPNYYSWAYFGLAQAALLRGDEATATSYQELAELWGLLGS